jgi:RecB family exonuclease
VKTSFSKLETYSKCPRLFANKHIHKLDVKIPQAVPLLKGIYVHEVLAEVLSPTTDSTCPQTVFATLLPAWLNTQHLELEVEQLLLFVRKFGDLIHRTLLLYRGPDAIRNKDGSPPEKLQDFPPAQWKTAFKESGLAEFKYQLDSQAASQNPEYIHISLSFLLGEIWAMTAYYSKPKWLKEVIGVEMPISTDESNEVILIENGDDEDVMLRAYIDLVGITKDDQTVILDHKTSKKKPLPEEVLYHPQLNLYAWIRRELYGKWDDLIGIYHALSGEYVLAQVDEEVVMENLHHFKQLEKMAELGDYPRRHPLEFATPCMYRDYKTRRIKSTCPYLHVCWPLFYESIQSEIQ